MLQHFRNVMARKDEETGASAVEYGLLVAAIAAIVIIIVFALGGIVRDTFKNTCDNIASYDNNVTTKTTDCKTQG